jgi:hypothetical protein
MFQASNENGSWTITQPTWTAVATMYAANNSFQARAYVHGARAGTPTRYHRIRSRSGAGHARLSVMQRKAMMKKLLIAGALVAASALPVVAEIPHAIVFGDRDASGPSRERLGVGAQVGQFTAMTLVASRGTPTVERVTIQFADGDRGRQVVDLGTRAIDRDHPLVIRLSGAHYIEDVVIDFAPSSSGGLVIAGE